MSEYIYFFIWSIKNPIKFFIFFLNKASIFFNKFFIKKKLIKIMIKNKIKNLDNKIKPNKINIIINLAGEKIYVKNKINWKQTFIDPESEERLHRFSWIIDLISEPIVSQKKINWCEEQIHDWYEKFFFEIEFLTKNNKKWFSYTVSERIANIFLFYNKMNKQVPNSIKSNIELETIFLLNNLEYFKNSINNHIINNSRAIFFSGIILKKRKFLLESKKIFLNNYKKLITKDGFLREGSSNYQLIFHRWIIELMYFSKDHDIQFHLLLFRLSKKLFNGSNFFIYNKKKMNVLNFGDISPDFKSEWIKTILNYSKKKKKISSWSNLLLTKKNNNLLVNSYFNKKDKIIDTYPKSGWYKFNKFSHQIMFKLSKVEPKCYPGHFHYDQGHFIYSYMNNIIFSDTGRYNYHNSKDYFAKDHNTLTINDLGLIPKNKHLPCEYLISKNKIDVINNKEFLEIKISMSGFKRIKKKMIWIRKILIYKKKIVITDSINSCPAGMQIKTYFHLNNNIKFKNNIFHIKSKNISGFFDSNKLKLKKVKYFAASENYGEKNSMTKLVYKNNLTKEVSNINNCYTLKWNN